MGMKKYEFKQDEVLNFKRVDKAFISKIEKEMGVRNFTDQFLQALLSSSTS